MQIAKKILEKPQWILLKETTSKESKTANNDNVNCNNNNAANSRKKKGNKQAQPTSQKSNLKLNPYFIDDGDLIAFTILEPSSSEKQITANDFMSTVDLENQKQLNEKSSEVSRLRKERKNTPDNEGNEKKPKNNRRLEVGITIKIDDFNECNDVSN